MRVFSTFLLATSLLVGSCAVHAEWPRQYESEFLYWCTADGIWDVYEDEPLCEEGEVTRGRWKNLPVKVVISDALTKPALQAVEYWNHVLGFDVFKVTADQDAADIMVVPYGAAGPTAEAKRFSYEGRDYGAVLMYNGNSDPDVIVHELGHLLGLAHDKDNRRSLMYPYRAERLALIEAADRDALRWMYGL